MTEDIWYAINSAYVDINSDLSGGVMLPLVRGLFGLSAVAASGAKLTMSLSTFVVFYESVRLFVCGGLGLQVVRESVGVSHG
ncbi:hypothetical protein KFR76_05940 [Corynebacterium diphtheriae]|nr:hypothetical protein KFR76_05940 [Corynebacterium diphtheriae]